MGAQRPDLEGLDGQVQVVVGRGRAGEVQHPVERPLHVDVLGDVVADQREVGLALQVRDVLGRAGDEVVHAHHAGLAAEEKLAEVRADEASTSGDEHPHGRGD
jgi:hypothetical protein